MTTMAAPLIEGTVAPGFEAVRDAFAENFTHRGELGGACCVVRDGKSVVDLWGGVRDRATGDPWRAGTMVMVHSTTKGLAGMVMALAHSRGWLDYDERVCTYWPEFAQAGKATITVRQLLGHQAGLFAFDERVDRAVVADPDRLAAVMSRQRPAWPPGDRQAYHALTLGFYESELVRRVDPHHRTLGRCFAEEIAAPLGLDFHIGTPDSIPDDRLAPLEPPKLWKRLTGMPLPITLSAMNPRSVIHRALIANPGTGCYTDHGRIVRNLEVPSGGGVGSARAIATAYGAFADGGHALGLRPETIAALEAAAVPSRHGFHDEFFHGEAKFSLGFMKPSDSVRFGHGDRAYGAPGAGGSMGHADPELRIGYGYVTNRMGTDLQGDPRDVALRAAIPTE
jgi:CubicO group peptidase (beta-lactamase class C family)